MGVDDSKPGVELSNQEDEFDKTKKNGEESGKKDVTEDKPEKSEDQDEDKDLVVEENKGEDNNENKDDDGNKDNAYSQDDCRNRNEVCDKERTQEDSRLQSHGDSCGDIQDDCDDDDAEEEDDDDGCWVTPDNIAAVLMESNLLDVKPLQIVPVACLTTDFAMQVWSYSFFI